MKRTPGRSIRPGATLSGAGQASRRPSSLALVGDRRLRLRYRGLFDCALRWREGLGDGGGDAAGRVDLLRRDQAVELGAAILEQIEAEEIEGAAALDAVLEIDRGG